ncbi:MAG: zf-HC2 domain-containing protein [Dehalococcoidia bacterium]
MTCRHVRQFHDAYVDGELSSSMMAEVHAHLLQCPECQREVEMIRASGQVIAKDLSEPVLDSGFASRVVAQLQETGRRGESRLETRRGRRRRLWKMTISAGLPAAAAVLFFSVLIWPGAQTEVSPKLVLGETVTAGVKEVVNPTLAAVADTKQAAANLNQLLQISVGEARQGVEEGLERSQRPAPTGWRLLLEPFTGLLDEPESEASAGEDDQDIVRF